MIVDIKKAKQALKKYVEKYNPEDKKIKMKIEHIERVSQIAKQIATEQNLSEEDIELAELIGLLHDIGRFEQIRIYHTFKDKDSINHGEYGAKILFEEGLIREFIDTDKYDEIIKLAIINHNKIKIEENLTEKQKLHAKIIRDADKTDIFYLLITGDEKAIWESENMSDEIITDEIFKEFIEDKYINYKKMKTSGDLLVAHFAYIYDLYFKTSFTIFKNEQYVDRLYNRFKFTNKDTTEKIKIVYEKTKNYIEEKG